MIQLKNIERSYTTTGLRQRIPVITMSVCVSLVLALWMTMCIKKRQSDDRHSSVGELATRKTCQCPLGRVAALLAFI